MPGVIDSKLRILTGDILRALRMPAAEATQRSPRTFMTERFVYLPPRLILRALQLSAWPNSSSKTESDDHGGQLEVTFTHLFMN